jgi:hypothetical protein
LIVIIQKVLVKNSIVNVKKEEEIIKTEYGLLK